MPKPNTFRSSVTVVALIGLGAMGGQLIEPQLSFAQGSQSPPARQPDPKRSDEPRRDTDTRDTDQRDNDQRNRNSTNRRQRPFAFQSPQIESEFEDATRQLVVLERDMERSHEELRRRLSETRAMDGVRQEAALFEMLDQLLRDQELLHQYLVHSRTTWGGEIDDDEFVDDRANRPDPPARSDPNRP